MQRTAEATLDNENETAHTESATKVSKQLPQVSAESDVQEVVKEVAEAPEDTAGEGGGEEGGGEEGGGEEGEEEEEEEEEFEIEKILDAKKGQFPGGRMGYFVKWKGYGDEHNSWVDQKDAGNATELINNFWAEKKKSKLGPRKSEPAKPKPKLAEKPSRKSLAEVDSSAEPDVPAKKRGRPRKDVSPSDKIEGVEEDEDEPRVKKRPRKSNGVARQTAMQLSDDEEILGSMKRHMKVASWEDLVESIDTVERENGGELYVFFTLKNEQKRMRENSRVCAERFPQKLITFYESNLRWKREDDPVDGE